jgi:hypothetical protein
MPIPYHTYYHPHYAHASPAAIAMPIPSSSIITVPMPMPMPPTPTSLVSPTPVHSLLSVPQGVGSVGCGSAAPSEVEDANAEGPIISYGLVEAIFKHPESYAGVSRSRGRDSRASGRDVDSHASNASAGDSRASGSVVEGKASEKASDSDIGSMGTRSPTESSSVSGQEYAELEHAYGGSTGSSDANERVRGRHLGSPTLENGTKSMRLVEDPTKTREDVVDVGSEADAEGPDDDGVPTPGQEMVHHGPQEAYWHQSDYIASAPGVPVYY